uniref:Cyclic nucleotide-binding domain-containing protein n=1 Tax=Caenorhabditis tropicalis TaxID=1561998 RepID=A0A1I7U889_9PELO
MSENVSVTSSARRETFGGFAYRIYALKGWVQRARKRLTLFRKNDVDIETNFREAIREEPEEEEKQSSFLSFTVDEHSNSFYLWTCLVSLVALHPLIFTALSVFQDIHPFLRQTGPFNLIFDLINILDLIAHTRIEYVENGVAVKNLSKLMHNRLMSKFFILDVIAVIPAESLEVFGESFFWARINRLTKVYRLFDFSTQTDTRTTSPHAFGLFKLIFICLVIFHWNGCLYFHISKVYNYTTARLEHWIFSYDKIINPILADCVTDNPYDKDFCDTDDFLITHLPENEVQYTVTSFMETWDNKTKTLKFANFFRQYALSFYWSALTLVTLGEQPSPCTTFQNAFEIGDTLLGLVIFAVIVGDVGNMVVAINLRKSEFENVLDGCKRFMIYRKVPNLLRKKAVEYFAYVWAHGGAQVDEEEIAEFLPPRLFGEIAVEIHMDTLKKVKLFEVKRTDGQKLNESFLLPMDYICKKGDVGTEMYIVKEGFVEVVSEDGQTIFVTLPAGFVFGELSILNIPGNKNKNLRTAYVRSKGYSDLYVLDKEDLWEALREYPQAKDSLIEKGVQILEKDKMIDPNMVDDEEGDFNGSIEDYMEHLDQEVLKITKIIDDAEKTIHESQQAMKTRLFDMEMELIDEMKKMKRKEMKAKYMKGITVL